MTCKELIDYLSAFSPDEQVSLVVVNLKRRRVSKIKKHFILDESPALVVEIDGTEPLDESKKVGDADG